MLFPNLLMNIARPNETYSNKLVLEYREGNVMPECKNHATSSSLESFTLICSTCGCHVSLLSQIIQDI